MTTETTQHVTIGGVLHDPMRIRHLYLRPDLAASVSDAAREVGYVGVAYIRTVLADAIGYVENVSPVLLSEFSEPAALGKHDPSIHTGLHVVLHVSDQMDRYLRKAASDLGISVHELTVQALEAAVQAENRA